jgi:hypothetical protein
LDAGPQYFSAHKLIHFARQTINHCIYHDTTLTQDDETKTHAATNASASGAGAAAVAG